MMLFTDGTLSVAGVGVDRICPRTARASVGGIFPVGRRGSVRPGGAAGGVWVAVGR